VIAECGFAISNKLCNLHSAIYNFRVFIVGSSLLRKALITAVAAGAFVALYEVTILDSKYAMRETPEGTLQAPLPGERLMFTATAYCKGLLTTSGVAAQNGIAAADPSLLPVGSVIQMDSSDGSHDGIYAVLDTGPAVQGRQIDLYIWNCNEALKFGRQAVHLTVLRLGWNPRAVTPSFMDRLFKRGSAPAPPPLPSRPLPFAP
jgi:3D (Asp-Asp-Asp) domain-containing protein